MHLLKIAIAVVATLIVVACSPTQQQSIQTSVDRNVLNHTIGKAYAQIVTNQKTTTAGLFSRDPAYGRLVGQTALAGGDTVYKHVDANEAATSSVGIGIFGSTQKRIDYRLLYFRVGKDGLIKDYANGTVTGANVSCMDFVGGLIQNCGNEQQLAKDITQMDLVVRTSKGEPLSAWK